MTPRIEVLAEKKLVGKRMMMSLANNRTGELWKSFMTQPKNIANATSSNLISLQVYPPSYFSNFSSATEFEKWAAVEVSEFAQIPIDMETFILSEGLYAVFDYKGSGGERGIFDYIFRSWLPGSLYSLDDRPHFETLGEKYKNDDPASEEEIWIPIVRK